MRCIYQPSAWELNWTTHVREWQSDDAEWSVGCRHMREASDKVAALLQWIQDPSQDNPDVLSRWLCARPPVPIEPLVGHLRHPEFHCIGPSRDTLERMFSIAHIVLPSALQAGLRPLDGHVSRGPRVATPRALLFGGESVRSVRSRMSKAACGRLPQKGHPVRPDCLLGG